MDSETQTTSSRGWMFWLGWVLTVLPCLLLLMSASFKFIKGPDFEKGIEHIGWTVSKMTILGILEISCTILYLIPKTAVLGAILLAAYLGGATATHVRVDDPFFAPVLAGVLVWLGLWLREPRLRALIPFRQG